MNVKATLVKRQTAVKMQANYKANVTIRLLGRESHRGQSAVDKYPTVIPGTNGGTKQFSIVRQRQ